MPFPAQGSLAAAYLQGGVPQPSSRASEPLVMGGEVRLAPNAPEITRHGPGTWAHRCFPTGADPWAWVRGNHKVPRLHWAASSEAFCKPKNIAWARKPAGPS